MRGYPGAPAGVLVPRRTTCEIMGQLQKPASRAAPRGPPHCADEGINCAGRSAEVAPVVEFVGVFDPAVADVGAVVHVGDEDVLDARVRLSLGLFHRLADADDDEDHTGSSCDEPLLVYDLHVFDVNALVDWASEDNGGIFREGFKRGFVVEWEWRNDDAHAQLK